MLLFIKVSTVDNIDTNVVTLHYVAFEFQMDTTNYSTAY